MAARSHFQHGEGVGHGIAVGVMTSRKSTVIFCNHTIIDNLVYHYHTFIHFWCLH